MNLLNWDRNRIFIIKRKSVREDEVTDINLLFLISPLAWGNVAVIIKQIAITDWDKCFVKKAKSTVIMN